LVAGPQDSDSSAADADRQARLYAYGELLGWTDERQWVPGGLPEFVDTPWWRGVEVGPGKGEPAWRAWITAESTPLLRSYFERLLLRDSPQCRELEATLRERRFPTTEDAVVPIRLSLAHTEQTLALNRQQLDHELQGVGCSIVHTRGREAEVFKGMLECLLHAAAHVRGFPQNPSHGLEQLDDADLLELAARRVCLVARAQGNVTADELRTHAPGKDLKTWRRDTLSEWDQALDEWIARIFANLRSIVWNRAYGCATPFPVYVWFDTDRWTGQRRPTGQQISRGEVAWGEALRQITLEQLEELTSTHELDQQDATQPVPQLPPRRTPGPRAGNPRQRARDVTRADEAERLYAQGQTRDQIAEHQGVKVNTLNNIFSRLGRPRPWSE
jgi:hypothetical protein